MSVGVEPTTVRERVNLPALRRALDGRCRPATDLDLDRLTVSFVKLELDGPTLAVLEAPCGPGRTAIVTARWTGRERGERLVRRLNRRPVSPSAPFPSPAVHVPEVGVVFMAFPHDRRLDTLPRVISRGFPPGRRGEPGVEVVRYKPEGKCVLRLTFDSPGRQAQGLTTVYAKVSKRAIFDRTLAVLPHLPEIEATSGFTTPVVLGVDSELSLDYQAEVAGVAMAEALLAGEGAGVGAAVGVGLARLHASPVSLSRHWSSVDRADLLADNVAQLRRFAPSHGDTVALIHEEIEACLGEGSVRDVRCCHNDFHGDNILIHAGPGVTERSALCLLDFEDAAMGDPMNDVASMYAHLLALADEVPHRRAAIDAERRSFVDAYDPPDADRFAAWAAMHCLLLAYQALRHPHHWSTNRLESMVTAAGTLLSGDTP